MGRNTDPRHAAGNGASSVVRSPRGFKHLRISADCLGDGRAVEGGADLRKQRTLAVLVLVSDSVFDDRQSASGQWHDMRQSVFRAASRYGPSRPGKVDLVARHPADFTGSLT